MIMGPSKITGNMKIRLTFIENLPRIHNHEYTCFSLTISFLQTSEKATQDF